jgi:hypothetical protein
MMHKTHSLLMTAAAGTLALAITAPAMAQGTTPPPQGEHHGMSMEGHAGMNGSAKPEARSGTSEQMGSMAEHCHQMMESMKKTPPAAADPSEPNSKPHGC